MAPASSKITSRLHIARSAEDSSHQEATQDRTRLVDPSTRAGAPHVHANQKYCRVESCRWSCSFGGQRAGPKHPAAQARVGPFSRKARTLNVPNSDPLQSRTLSCPRSHLAWVGYRDAADRSNNSVATPGRCAQHRATPVGYGTKAKGNMRTPHKRRAANRADEVTPSKAGGGPVQPLSATN